MSIIGKTIRTEDLKGVVLYEYQGLNKSYKSVANGYLSMDYSEPSYKTVIDKTYNETCLVILDKNNKQHHVFAS